MTDREKCRKCNKPTSWSVKLLINKGDGVLDVSDGFGDYGPWCKLCLLEIIGEYKE